MSSAEVLMFFMMFVILVLLVALLVYLWASLHILTGDDFAMWPSTTEKKRKKEMEDMATNIIAALKNGGGTLPIKVPERRPPFEGGIRPEPQSYDEEIAEINNVNYQTGIGPSVGAK